MISWKKLTRQRFWPGSTAPEPCCPNSTADSSFRKKELAILDYKKKQNCRLASACVSPEQKYFDQQMQTVENGTIFSKSSQSSSKSSFRRLSRNINCTNHFFILSERVGITSFRSSFFVSQIQKKFPEYFNESKKFGFRNFFCMGRVCHNFVSKTFCITLPKTS